MAWASVPIPLWLRWCGFILIGCWGLLFVWTFQTLGKNLTDTVVTRKDHTLVTTGPYRYVRHPFYTCVPHRCRRRKHRDGQLVSPRNQPASVRIYRCSDSH